MSILKIHIVKYMLKSCNYFEYIGRLGKPLPAICRGNPDLYIICRGDENELSIGLWNFFADPVENPIIELSDSYSSAEFINCNGSLKENKLYLSKLSAFEFAFIKLT